MLAVSIGLSTLEMACISDPPPAAIAPTAPATSATPPSTAPDACSEIAGACHEHDAKADGGTASIIHECHELGHAHKLQACVSRKQQCLDACAGHAH